MKALIFNSGLGSRLGELTTDRSKCLVQLSNGETIFHRQLRLLSACGVREFVVTTGPFAELVEAEAAEFEEKGCIFHFVPNVRYGETNYIYSMWLAREYLRDNEILVLHGDLVFDAAWISEILRAPYGSVGSVNPLLPLPEKDFRAHIVDDNVHAVGVGLASAPASECMAFQACYRLSKQAINIWLGAVEQFAASNETDVYAENAANTVFEQMKVHALSYEKHVLEEIDTPEDLERVSRIITLRDYVDQPVYELKEEVLSLISGTVVGALSDAHALLEILSALEMHHPLVITAPFFEDLSIADTLKKADISFEVFTDYAPNPTSDDVDCALSVYRSAGCDSLMSIGGGSSIDIAKCIKALLAMGEGACGIDLAGSTIPFATTPHIAIPTTAGTGSESTHFAVCYVNGKKVSVVAEPLLPDVAILDASLLVGLPDYQRKSTMLDALAQAIESHWSLRSCPESRVCSSAAIPAIMSNWQAYLAGNTPAARKILLAANLAGKAINITTTTAAHAMSYKITSFFGYTHGHAVALCLPACWELLIERAEGETVQRLHEIDALMCGTADVPLGAGLTVFQDLFAATSLPMHLENTDNRIDELVRSVNPERLSNFPVVLDKDDIYKLYMGLWTKAQT